MIYKNQARTIRIPAGVTGLSFTTALLSKDGGEFSGSLTVTESVAVTGTYSIDMSQADMNADAVDIYIKDTTGEYAYSLSIATDDISSLATSAMLSTVNQNTTGIKAKTDLIPASPAAIGSEMALTSAATTAVQNGLANAADLSDINDIVSTMLVQTGSTGVAVATASKSGYTLAAGHGLATATNLATMQTTANAIYQEVLDIETASGTGSTLFTYTVKSSTTSAGISGVKVWITSDEAGEAVIAGPQLSDDSGITRWYLDPGTSYYFFRTKAGWTFTNPDSEVVS